MPSCLELPDAAPGELVVARAWSWKAEPLRRSAERQYVEMLAHGEDPYYAVSAWGMEVPETGEVLATMQTLCRYMVERVNARWIGFAPGHRFQQEGFPLVPSGEQYHLDVVLQDPIQVADLTRLEGLWNETCRRHFADCTLE